MNKNKLDNKPLMFIDTLQEIKIKNSSQTFYDTRYGNNKNKIK